MKKPVPYTLQLFEAIVAGAKAKGHPIPSRRVSEMRIALRELNVSARNLADACLHEDGHLQPPRSTAIERMWLVLARDLYWRRRQRAIPDHPK